MNAEELTRELGGKNGVARCPAHDDRTPSFSIRDSDDGSVLVHCFTGCSQADVIDALRRLGLWDGCKPSISQHRQPPKPAEKDTSDVARSLWRQRQPIAGSLAETYLRATRGITCPLPETLGYLPSNGRHPASLIAPFGLRVEAEPGVLVVPEHVEAVHLIRL